MYSEAKLDCDCDVSSAYHWAFSVIGSW